MKKLYLFILSLFFVVSVSQAQFFSAGLKAGGQTCALALSPSDGLELSGIFGWHAGAYAKIKSPIKLGGKLEVLYSARGGDITSPAINAGLTQIPEITSEFRTSYVDIPLLATFNIIKPLSIEAGPQFSFLTNGETTTNGTTEDYEPDNSPEIGFAAGVDFNLPAKLGVYLRYNIGFNSETTSETDPLTGATTEFKTDVTQSWFQFGLKYRLVEPL
jgi:hypothetical protein